MNRSLVVVEAARGEVITDATLSAQDMAYLNFAREEHKRLDRIIRTVVIPMVGGYRTDLGEALDRHLEQIVRFSGNYCWKHRHLGAAHDAVDVGGGQ